MSKDFTAEIRDTLLDTMEASLAAQLRAVRRLRDDGSGLDPSKDKGMSQVDMSFDILRRARRPLHISEILSGIADKFGVEIDRESLVSAMTKKVQKKERFKRTDKNTFEVI